MKRLFAVLVLSLFAVSPAFAKHDCPMSGGDCSSKSSSSCSEKSSGGCPIVGKVMMKAGFMLDNRTELGLSPEQIQGIETLKFDVERSSIRQKAEMELFMLDLMQQLKADQPNVETINASIDTGSPAMTQAAKDAVAAYVKLKSILTPDQHAKMKALWTSKKR